MLSKEDKVRYEWLKRIWWWRYPLTAFMFGVCIWIYADARNGFDLAYYIENDIYYYYPKSSYISGFSLLLLWVLVAPILAYPLDIAFLRRRVDSVAVFVVLLCIVLGFFLSKTERERIEARGYMDCRATMGELSWWQELQLVGLTIYGKDEAACRADYTSEQLERFKRIEYYLYHAPPEERTIPPQGFPPDLMPKMKRGGSLARAAPPCSSPDPEGGGGGESGSGTG